MAASNEKLVAMNDRDTGVRSVRLTLDVLEILAQAEREMGVTEIAERLGVSKPSVFRHLSTLAERGYLAQNPETARYHWGPRLFLLARTAPPRFDLVATAAPIMADLRDRLDETIVLAAPNARQLVVLATVGSRRQIEIGVRSGSRLALHASAQGKVALAFGPPSLREHVQPMVGYTSHTVTDPARLDAEVAAVRAQGWAIAPGELMLGVNALAVPVFNAAGALVATLAAVGLLQTIGAEPRALPIAAMQSVAGLITRAIRDGYGDSADAV